MNIAAGTRLGRYEIRSKIGEGGMGEVYRAYDPKVNREVAIKILPASLSTDKDRLARFEQEAQAAGGLNHPNILIIHHVDTHDGAPYIVSELLEGETLRERMGGVALPQRKAIDYALQMVHGLAAAHEKGIVHRDLKPENIFITKDGRVKILDFGLAKLTGADNGQSQTEVPTRRVNTDAGVVMGTIGYMSPEQVRGKPADHRSDIFSFGAVLYEMLSGRRAFRGESTADTISAILREDPPELSSTNRGINPALERVVNHCLEKSPEERFNSARDLAFAIEALSGSATNSDATTVLAVLPATRRKRREVIAAENSLRQPAHQVHITTSRSRLMERARQYKRSMTETVISGLWIWSVACRCASRLASTLMTIRRGRRTVTFSSTPPAGETRSGFSEGIQLAPEMRNKFMNRLRRLMTAPIGRRTLRTCCLGLSATSR